VLSDTHCHIHSRDFPLEAETVLAAALNEGVDNLICVGTDAADSRMAAEFADKHEHCWASVGLHPHDAKAGAKPFKELRVLLSDAELSPRIVAIGECGLDYYYDYSPRAQQQAAFQSQLELAVEFDLPLIFHVRQAFADFWRIMADFPDVRGVIHSFSGNPAELKPLLERGFFIGLNGIMTFTKNDFQLAAAKAIPLKQLLLETDAPFLTPVPIRGKVNEPRYVAFVASFLAELRQERLSVLAKTTSNNAAKLFKFK